MGAGEEQEYRRKLEKGYLEKLSECADYCAEWYGHDDEQFLWNVRRCAEALIGALCAGCTGVDRGTIDKEAAKRSSTSLPGFLHAHRSVVQGDTTSILTLHKYGTDGAHLRLPLGKRVDPAHLRNVSKRLSADTKHLLGSYFPTHPVDERLRYALADLAEGRRRAGMRTSVEVDRAVSTAVEAAERGLRAKVKEESSDVARDAASGGRRHEKSFWERLGGARFFVPVAAIAMALTTVGALTLTGRVRDSDRRSTNTTSSVEPDSPSLSRDASLVTARDVEFAEDAGAGGAVARPDAAVASASAVASLRDAPTAATRRAPPLACPPQSLEISGARLAITQPPHPRPYWPSAHPFPTISVSSFCIARRDVTNSEFQRCVEADSRCRTASEAAPDVRCFRAPGAASGSDPLLCATWEEARAYCTWRHERVPAIREWERFAAVMSSNAARSSVRTGEISFRGGSYWASDDYPPRVFGFRGPPCASGACRHMWFSPAMPSTLATGDPALSWNQGGPAPQRDPSRHLRCVSTPR